MAHTNRCAVSEVNAANAHNEETHECNEYNESSNVINVIHEYFLYSRRTPRVRDLNLKRILVCESNNFINCKKFYINIKSLVQNM